LFPCGGGCTVAAFNLANKRADALVAKMGPGWEKYVHENLGWHYSVIFTGTSLRLHEYWEGKEVDHYWLDSQRVCDGHHFKGEDPHALLREAMDQQIKNCLQHIQGLETLREAINGIPK
jgi:hypothetical protein